MDGSRLDGNAAAGALGELFAFETTTARVACAGCGADDEIGAQIAYVTEIGTVVRCASCDRALIRVVSGPGRRWLDLRGVRYLQIGRATQRPPS